MAAGQARPMRNSMVCGDLAYDLDTVTHEHVLRHAGESSHRQVASAPQVRRISRVKPRVRQKLSWLSMLGCCAVGVMMVVVLLCYVQLTEISDSIVTLKSELKQLETDNISLQTKYEQTFDLTTVKQAAKELGMSTPSASQIYHIDLYGVDNAVVYQNENENVLAQVFTSFNSGISTVVEYFE